MKKLMSFVALFGLALTAIPSVLVFVGSITPEINKQLMALGTVIWFVAAPIWFRKSREV